MSQRWIVRVAYLGAVALSLVSFAAASSAAAVPNKQPRHSSCRLHLRIHHRTVCVSIPAGVTRPAHRSEQQGGPSSTVPLPTDGGLGGVGFDAGQSAIAWAQSMRGNTRYAWYCELFVENAFNTSGRYASAWTAARALGLHGGVAPAGTLVFFRPDSSNGEYGHVGISLGGGNMVSALSSVQDTNIFANRYWRALYAGWAYAPPSWPGRNIVPIPPPSQTTPPSQPTNPAPAPAPTPTPAPAPAPTPTPQPGQQFFVHHVYGTCRDGACGLKVHTAPQLSAPVTHVIGDGTQVDIVCQARGDTVSNGHYSSAIWDRQTDGTWVSDFYIDTPNVGTWSPPIPQC